MFLFRQQIKLAVEAEVVTHSSRVERSADETTTEAVEVTTFDSEEEEDG